MNDVDEIDRIWRDGLRHLAGPATPHPDPAAMLGAPSGRRHRARLAGAVTAGVLIVAAVLGVATVGRQRVATHAGPGTAVPAPPLVVEAVDAPGGTLAISFPGRTISGQPPHVELPAGIIEFRIDMRTAGHELTLDGVSAFAPTPDVAGVVTRTLRLAPGIYRLYCSVPGHAEAGEQVLLDVR